MKQKIAEFINIIFGFRKFILMLILYAVGIIFRIENLLNGTEMVNLFSSTTIAFMGANSVEHLMTTVKEYVNSKGQPVTVVQTPPAPQGDNLVDEADDTSVPTVASNGK